MSRVYNFSAGPAVLPEEVLREAAAEMLDYQGSGMSVMEMSHRSKDFQAIIDDAEKDLRELMQIPDNYKVLFVQGGGNMQFAMVPMNLFKNKVGDYIITGQWAKKAYQEAKMFGTAPALMKIASSSGNQNNCLKHQIDPTYPAKSPHKRIRIKCPERPDQECRINPIKRM